MAVATSACHGAAPPTSSASPMARPARTPTTRTGLLRTNVLMEDLLDGPMKEPTDGQGERQRWQIPARLDGVHRLTRHGEAGRQLTLAQADLLAEPPNLALHPVKVA